MYKCVVCKQDRVFFLPVGGWAAAEYNYLSVCLCVCAFIICNPMNHVNSEI